VHAGPTAVVEQRYDSEQRCTVPEEPAHTALVFPHQGNFLTFAGDLAHGVIESLDKGLRMTLLINWWAHQPQVCRRKRRLHGAKQEACYCDSSRVANNLYQVAVISPDATRL
jgi:hypothetical protein